MTLLAIACGAGSLAGLGAGATASAAQGPVDPNASVAYQHDPAHDGHSSDSSFVTPLTKAWSTTLGGKVTSPLVVDGRVFVDVGTTSTYDASVEALSLATGEKLWGPVSIGTSYSWEPIAYDDGQVFAVNYGGQLTALDAATGTVNWVRQLRGQYAFSAPPTAVHGTVYVGGAGMGGTLYYK